MELLFLVSNPLIIGILFYHVTLYLFNRPQIRTHSGHER